MYAKAIYVDGRIVTGRHHGEAFGMLSDKEKCSDTLLSGFYDESTGRFFYDDQSFYTKSIYLVRHSRPSKGYDEDQDPDLSQEGVEKAHKLATFLMDAGLKDYEGYTSPYLRCLITADIIARMTGIQFTVDPCLTEPAEDDILLENHAKDFPQFCWPTSDEFRIEKEDPSSYSSRLKSVAEHLPSQAVVVTHYSPITCLARLVSGAADVVSENLPMASLTYIYNNQIVHFGKQV
jgi:broad specificity phosphatase PhoE